MAYKTVNEAFWTDPKIKRRKISDKLKEKIFLKYHGKCADCGEPPEEEAGWFKRDIFFSYSDTSPLKPPIKIKNKEKLNKLSNKQKMFTCGNLEIHHILPVTSNGNNEENNLILLCSDCHKKRHCRGH